MMRRSAARLGSRAVGALLRGRPVPVAAIQALARLGGRDALLPPSAAHTWAVGSEGLEFLTQTLQRLAPSRVLEFGCGDSTIHMARVLAALHGDDDVHVLSVEQDGAVVEECRSRLAAEGLNAAITACALAPQPAPDEETESYDLTDDFLTALLGGGRPDMIVIDGPSGGRWVRYPIIPRVQAYLRGATPFLLHDALRDYELRLAAAWAKLPGVTIDGVHVVDEGFLAGTVRPLAS
jgi:hypothetical protein